MATVVAARAQLGIAFSDAHRWRTEQLSTSALYADLEAIAAGYGIAWIEGVGFRFMIKKANGSTQCTSSVVPFGTVPTNQQLAVSDSVNGNVVVATSPDGNLIHFYRFDKRLQTHG